MAKKRVNKKSKTHKKVSNINIWLERETPHTQAALENASRHFDDKNGLTVNTLEAIGVRLRANQQFHKRMRSNIIQVGFTQESMLLA